jgi:hypothetical protein
VYKEISRQISTWYARVEALGRGSIRVCTLYTILHKPITILSRTVQPQRRTAPFGLCVCRDDSGCFRDAAGTLSDWPDVKRRCPAAHHEDHRQPVTTDAYVGRPRMTSATKRERRSSKMEAVSVDTKVILPTSFPRRKS